MTRVKKKKPAEVVARSLTIVDEKGQPQMLLSAGSRSGVHLHLLNGGCSSLSLDVSDGNPSITFFSSRNRVRLSIGCDDQTAGVMLYDAEGKPAAIHGIDPKGKLKKITYRTRKKRALARKRGSGEGRKAGHK